MPSRTESSSVATLHVRIASGAPARAGEITNGGRVGESDDEAHLRVPARKCDQLQGVHRRPVALAALERAQMGEHLGEDGVSFGDPVDLDASAAGGGHDALGQHLPDVRGYLLEDEWLGATLLAGIAEVHYRFRPPRQAPTS